MAVKGLTAKIFASWLSPHDALKRVSETAIAVSPHSAILDRLKGGLIEAVAADARFTDDRGVPVKVRMFSIPEKNWDWITSNDFWNTGDVNFSKPPPPMVLSLESPAVIRCFVVKFEPTGIKNLIASLPKKVLEQSAPPSTRPAPIEPRSSQKPLKKIRVSNPGGRPKKDYWDALWAAMAAKLYNGDFKPNRQADIEKAMLDWAAAHGHDMSEQSARSRARILMAALQKDKN